jgi:hypothetical protein
MANIEIRASLHDAEALRGLEELGRAGRTGIARALKRTGISERAQLARDVGKDTGLGVARVKDEISTRVNVDGGTVTLTTAGVRIPLIEFQARGPRPSRGRKGSRVTAIRFGQRVGYPGAFIATVFGALPSGVTSSGHEGVFRRLGQKRLPIKQLYGPSIATVFGKHLPAAVSRGVEVLGKNLQHELQFALAQVSR